MSSIDDKINFNLTQEQKNIIFENLDEYGKLSCIKSFKVAKKIGCELKDMSAITKSMNIKITNCELGVFGNLEFLEKNEEVYSNLKNKYLKKEISCKNLWEEAKKSSLKIVGSTVKNSDIEVIYCQLGCFREKKGLKNGSKS